ncbi:hypothetical protein SAMN05421810_101931 [Amycolatopsis arida]|uniref:Uncharacterized protein n=1 Tax=Amycolatopsis arida TaxID=587909 RepID=A0A1I5MID7_9PSEU|nr:hypothetical protein [Amycolatopsis arida]TDX94105.1 hypothetical protein CLV69_104563 [Amycolatopsis arida]SFP09280.1 hypothetical protein SAMN05421810_101931 [Amycolatopsis arida]
MTATLPTRPARPRPGLVETLNTRRHRPALVAFAVLVLAHWAEHIAQAVQVYLLGWPVPEALGVLGLWLPWVVTSEWLHYSYAIGMLVCFVVLRHGFVGRAASWWRAALWIQFWHHLEHLLLLLQAVTGTYLLGFDKPTSIVQLVIPRVELHLFYNTIVFVPMVVAMVRHRRPLPAERDRIACGCAVSAPRPPAE